MKREPIFVRTKLNEKNENLELSRFSHIHIIKELDVTLL